MSGYPARLGRVVKTTAPFGLAAGTLYFIVIGVLSFFTAVVAGGSLSLFGLVLFVGVGAAVGLVFGVVDAVALAGALPIVGQGWRGRLVAAAAGGVPVLALTYVELRTGVIGVLEPDWTTVVVLPTAVAAIGSAAAAPGLIE